MRTFIIVILGLSLLSCKAVQMVTESQVVKDKLGDTIGDEEAESIIKITDALRKSFDDLTPQEEYYIGRAVSANVLQKYAVLDNEDLTQYINEVGLTVAWASDRPETYGGYHFIILDTDDPLAYSAPGGFVFISKGLMAVMKDEEELAGVLAHEVAHISNKHGLSAIKQSRLMDAFGILVAEGKKYSSDEIQKLANIYEGVLDDIVTTLVEKGYSRVQEDKADRSGASYAFQAGYDPQGLTSFLETLAELEALKKQEGRTFEFGLVKSHPDPADRGMKLGQYLQEKGMVGRTEALRTTRFESMKKILG
jgi:predicted Zn-dependent protease